MKFIFCQILRSNYVSDLNYPESFHTMERVEGNLTSTPGNVKDVVLYSHKFKNIY